jgi:hypothetical protein
LVDWFNGFLVDWGNTVGGLNSETFRAVSLGGIAGLEVVQSSGFPVGLVGGGATGSLGDSSDEPAVDSLVGQSGSS